MRVMILRKADRQTEAGELPSEALIAAMGKYIEEMVQAGVMISGDGLKPSVTGARVKFTGGRATVIDGPFSETKELIAGVSVLQVDSMQEAIDWVKRWPQIDGDGGVELEIRPMYELEDFGSSEGVEHIRKVGFAEPR